MCLSIASTILLRKVDQKVMSRKQCLTLPLREMVESTMRNPLHSLPPTVYTHYKQTKCLGEHSMTGESIHILLCEDQTLMRQGLHTVLELEPGFEVVAEAADGEE